ncbi:outer membrane autotransporter barrel domain-containing protein [Brucella sp. F96/2]|uniref:autotransporter outer membrane beta-barrel domain-containing protein n=3 Tax=Brucella ceti TaxID=120577 RepID=UPI0002CFEF0F|nr:outer membrane autotransporter barrel domain-containing protein [Brucella sp. F96/2]ENT20294.1 outer membrane autotransporter barrel domain-containing protein [Brucella sp. UK1/97]
MRSVRTVIHSSAVLIAVLYATVSVHAGGQGGYGAFNSEPYGYPGGDGNSATGMGGDGGQGCLNPSPGGAGGTVGSLITSPTTIISNITGGAGEHAVDQTRFAGNGGGGGGTGVATASDVTNDATIIGGQGGRYSTGHSQGAGGGGGGGAGVATSANFTNNSTVIGGAGGLGANDGPVHNNSGGGGGGAGVYVVGNSALVTIINNGTITGGAGGLNSAWPDNFGATGGMGEGGAAGSIRTGGSQGTSSQGGAGIIGANIAVINNGTITGGIGGTGGLNAGVQNDAVTFQSGINSLTLTTKSVINGVVSANGNDDTLTLQNTLSKIDGGQSDGANISATQYKGFEHLVVNGGRWTVSGSAIVSGETTLNGGALVVTGPAALGVQAITAQGGAIEASGDQVLDQSFVLKNNPYGASTSGLVVQGADNLVLSGVLSDVGRLTKNGSGTLTLTADNTYTGGTVFAGGVVSVDKEVRLGGGDLTFNGGTLQVTGTGWTSTSRAVSLQAGGGTFDIEDAANNFAVTQGVTGAGGLMKSGTGTVTLSGANSYTGGTKVSAGTLVVANDNTGGGTTTVDAGAGLQIGTGGTSGSLAGDIANDGTLVVDRSDAIGLSGAISGAGGLTKNGAGTLTLSGANSYTGATKVSAGTLTQGAAGGFSTASSRYDVDTDGTLDLGGFDTMLAALYNAGTINMNVGAAGSTLMVNGDYVGHDGTIVFNTVLGDDNSKTDKLMVGGDTAGNTNVQVVNRDGLGAQTVKGIEIITVGGQSNGVFSLVSDYRTKDGQKAVVGGAYAYTLHQGPARGANDGNWYLISQLEDIKPDNPATRRVSDTPDAPDTPAPRYSANVPVYEGYVQTMQALNKPSTLQERVGKRYMTGENGDGRTSGGMVDAHGIWARIQGAHDRLEPTTLTGMKQEINTFILQAGVDGQFYEDENGKLIAGITGQYGTARSNIVARDGDGRISTNAWSLGATATWIGNDGFYVDTQGQVTWFESDLNSDTADVGLASGRKATGYALSVETGKRIALNGNWALTPQAQLIWSSINADDFEDVWQANISVARGNSFAARFGLAASYDSSWQGSDGRVVNTSVYGITNLYQEFLGGTRVNISGVDFSTDNDRTWAGIGAGGTYAWAGGKYLIFGQGTINTSLDHFADSYAIKGDVGFKVKW